LLAFTNLIKAMMKKEYDKRQVYFSHGKKVSNLTELEVSNLIESEGFFFWYCIINYFLFEKILK
jgi:phage-related holin